MDEVKWELYRTSLQGHPSIPYTTYNVKELEYVKEYFPEGSFVLDIGCADGQEALSLQENGYKVIGLTNDGDGHVIDYINKTYPQITVFDMDMNSLEFDNNIFDCIYMKHTFEHSFSPFIFMLELNRVLKPGGLILTEHPIFVPDSDIDTVRISHHHPNLLTAEQHLDLFKSTGFIVEKFLDMGYCHRYLLKKDDSILHSTVHYALQNVRDYMESK
jgi:SAM-dependent methyltransferase